MNCDEVRQHWELYYDSEGDSELYQHINEHIAGCASCAQWFSQQARFEDGLAAKLFAAPSSVEMWQRIVAKTGVVRPAETRSGSFFSPFFALAASLMLAVGIWQFNIPSEPEHLSTLTATVHQQLTDGKEPIDFVSESDVAVEEFLKERVNFPVRCPPRKDAGFVVRGGGVCTLGGDSAAYVVGEVADQEVSIFILPEDRLAQFIHERAVLSHQPIHHCREGYYQMVLAKIDRNVVVVIGKGSPVDLERVVRAYGTYPEATLDDTSQEFSI